MIFGKKTLIRTQADLNEYVAREKSRGQANHGKISSIVAEIVSEMREARTSVDRLNLLDRGARLFDAPNAKKFELIIEPKEIKLDEKIQDAIDKAINRVLKFHEIQFQMLFSRWAKSGTGYDWKTPISASKEGGSEGQIVRSVQSAGIYVPGGRASYPSSAIMNLAPAKAAGVKDLYLATPMMPDGTLSPAIEYICWKLGVKKVILAGGAYGISALALGIEGQFEPVDMIVGPGNRFVNEAKRLFWGEVGLDGMAGPSEIAVVMDEDAQPEWAALDLLAQIEHAPDNIPRLYCLNESMFEGTALPAIESALKKCPREEGMRLALKNEGEVVIFPRDGLDQSKILESVGTAINAFAPEHLALHILRPHSLLPFIRNAGSISLGSYSAQSFGDYATGHSHTVPTGRASRFGSPVNIMTFMKLSSLSEVFPSDVVELAEISEVLAGLEGLPTHGYCASARVTNKS